MAALREALEQALAENPDDLAAHAAYADLLSEQGDPRGEFIQVQLALEDPTRSAEERGRLQAREAELLREHQREWLGELVGLLLDEKGITSWRRKHNKIGQGRWARGWLDNLYLWDLDLNGARILARNPAARMLRRLHIEGIAFEEEYQAEPGELIPEGTECPALYGLWQAPFLAGLRVFQLGETVNFEEDLYNCQTSGEGVADLVGRMPRLEELYLLAHDLDLARLFALSNLTALRVLQVYHERDYPLEVLAGNPALGRLTTLRLHPRHGFGDECYLPRARVQTLLDSPNLPSLAHLHLHASDLGDEGCAAIVTSGILKRLKTLDLKHGCITDRGARILAECPDVRRLELLSLENNQLTRAGQEILQGLGIPVRCAPQADEGSTDYLWTGDME